MEVEQYPQYTLFAQLNEDINNKDILVEQLKEITNREGYAFQALSDMIYTITLDKIAPETAISAFKILDGVTVALPHKTISISSDIINQEYIEKKLKMPISSLETINANLTHIHFDSVEKKQKALKKILKDDKLKQLVILDSLTSTHVELSTEHSNFSSRSSIECSPTRKNQQINRKRRASEQLGQTEDEVVSQSKNVENKEAECAQTSSSLRHIDEDQGEQIANQEQIVQEDVDKQSAQEPQIRKKRKLEQGLECIELGFQYILLLTLISVLCLRLFKGFSHQ